MIGSWLRGRVHSLRAHVDSLGAAETALYAFQRLRLGLAPSRAPYVRLASKHSAHRLFCRPGTSDLAVFAQIYCTREYRCLDDVRDARLVIDCGANVGYASTYFLTRFPDADVIAVEPDRANFDALRANVAPYGARCKTVNTGIWSHPTGLVMSDEPWGDGREWARTVRPARVGETPAMTATDISSLLEDSGHSRISVLKIDIEGAEAVVFGANYHQWLSRVDNLVIELHGNRERAIVLEAIASDSFVTSECDELFVCKRATDATARHERP